MSRRDRVFTGGGSRNLNLEVLADNGWGRPRQKRAINPSESGKECARRGYPISACRVSSPAHHLAWMKAYVSERRRLHLAIPQVFTRAIKKREAVAC